MWVWGARKWPHYTLYLWSLASCAVLSAVVASPLPGSEPFQSPSPTSQHTHTAFTHSSSYPAHPKLQSRSSEGDQLQPPSDSRLNDLLSFGSADPDGRLAWCWVYTILGYVQPILPSLLESKVETASASCHRTLSQPLSSGLSAYSAPSLHRTHKLPTRFDQYQQDVVLRFVITSPRDASSLRDAASILFLDVWDFTDDWADVRLARDVVPALLGLLPPSLRSSYTILIRDLAQAVADTYPHPADDNGKFTHDRVHSPVDATVPIENRYSHNLPVPLPVGQSASSSTGGRIKCPGRSNIFFTDYQPLSVIHPWMRLLESMFSSHTRVLNLGQSYEGRDILALKVGVHPTNSQRSTGPRRTIVVSGGSHAREWISTMAVNYAAYTFITSYGKTQPFSELIQAFDWIFVPTLNPDGYVYTWETDRLWRKTRQPTPLRFCKGIDIDRSFSFHWDEDASKSSTPCSESWPGSSPFEAVEALVLRDWARNLTDSGSAEIVSFIDLHSYAQQVLYPYSYSCADEPPSLENLQELGMGLAKAIRLTPNSGSQVYQVLSACEGNVNVGCQRSGNKKGSCSAPSFPRIIAGGGSALDWFYDEIRARSSFQIKLRDTGSYGFLLPREEIIPTGREMVEAFSHLGRRILGEIGLASAGGDGMDPNLDGKKGEVGVDSLRMASQKQMPTEGLDHTVATAVAPAEVPFAREGHGPKGGHFLADGSRLHAETL